MNNKNEAFSNLMQTLDAAKIKLHPLPKHYLADKFDTRTKELYASLLGSVMLSNSRISDIEHRLFTMLLASLAIDVKVDQYLNNLDTLEVQELFEQLENDDEKQVLIFDSLLLSRCTSPLTTEQVKLISELSDLLSIGTDDLIYTVYWAGKVLGLDITLSLRNDNKYINNFESTHILKDIKKNINLEGFIEKGKLLIQALIVHDEYTLATHSSTGIHFLTGRKIDEKEYIKSKYTGFILNSEITNNSKVSFEIIKHPLYLSGWEKYLSDLYT